MSLTAVRSSNTVSLLISHMLEPHRQGKPISDYKEKNDNLHRSVLCSCPQRNQQQNPIHVGWPRIYPMCFPLQRIQPKEMFSNIFQR